MIAQTVGFLRSYFTWFTTYPSVIWIGMTYIYQMLWYVSSGGNNGQTRCGERECSTFLADFSRKA